MNPSTINASPTNRPIPLNRLSVTLFFRTVAESTRTRIPRIMRNIAAEFSPASSLNDSTTAEIVFEQIMKKVNLKNSVSR